MAGWKDNVQNSVRAPSCDAAQAEGGSLKQLKQAEWLDLSGSKDARVQ